MAGVDGVSNCDTLCNPANHYERSCKKFCPGYLFTSSTSTITVPVFTEASSNSDFVWILLITLGTLSVGAAFVVVICILCNKGNTRKHCPLKNEKLTNPIQETETTLFRYENELNEKTKQLQALTVNEHDRFDEADTGQSVTDNPGDIDPLLPTTLPKSNSLQNSFNGAADTAGQKISDKNSYQEGGRNQASSSGRSWPELNGISGNRGQSQQTRSADIQDAGIDSDATLSNDDITVKDDSSDEDSNDDGLDDNKRPKRILRVVTEIEV